VEVALSALILGPVFTTLTVPDYFTDPKLYRYFGNIFGFVDFFLPGVFADNPVPHFVNANLWTLPAEFYCYLISSALIVSGLFFRRIVFGSMVAALTLAALAGSLTVDYGVTPRSLYGTPVVVYYFLVGCVFFHWKDKIPFHWGYFAAACLISLLALAIPRAVFVAPIFVTYSTIFIGAISWPKLIMIQRGDYSYGVYLYGFPISQALIAAIPQLHGHEHVFALLAGILTFAFAAISWTWIEKPTLQLKRHFSPRHAAK
jgi:peptidoglycan/LPS O-acetylase OafA/YrhL